MAFRLRQQESVAHGLHRLALKQLGVAADELQRSHGLEDEAVHEARKSIKKVRAILNLIRADYGRHLSNSRKRLRALNRRLSKLRDVDAPLEVLEKIRRSHPHLLSEHTSARVRRLLSAHKQEVIEAARRQHSCDKAVTAILALRKAAKRWRPRHDGFGALAAGLRIAHRRGRKAMKRADTRQGAADFHEWRKQIKTLWYALRLLEAGGARIRRDVRTLDRAERMLGDEHNAVVLCEQVFNDGTLRAAAELDGLRSAADRYQRGLRRTALAAAGRVYELRPAEYVRRVHRAWKRWHRAAPSRRGRTPRRAAA